MKRNFILKRFISTLAVISFLMGGGVTFAEQPKILRLVTDWPAGSNTELVKAVFIDEVAKKTGGRIKIEMYPGSQLVASDNHVDAISSGMVEMAVTQLSEGWPTVAPSLTILGISLFDNSAHAFRSLDGPLGKMLAGELEKKTNTKVLNWTTAGDIDVMGCAPKLIKTPDDLKGLKFRVSSNSDAASCKALGGTPVIIAGSEMYMALQRGTVDGIFITSTRGVEVSRSYEVCKNYTRIPLVVGAQFAFVINRDAWEGLSKEIQEILMSVSAEAREAMLAKLQAGGDRVWKEKMATYPGVKTYHVPENELGLWKEKMLPARMELLEKAVSKDRAKEMLNWLAEAR
ncbi:MAG: TRAP transporter substrate-binding protein [Deltaproteobacteria bacterium]|nr:TRAP transporter substrate-binding protein [Deltaproteobacteria bacterium]